MLRFDERRCHRAVPASRSSRGTTAQLSSKTCFPCTASGTIGWPCSSATSAISTSWAGGSATDVLVRSTLTCGWQPATATAAASTNTAARGRTHNPFSMPILSSTPTGTGPVSTARDDAVRTAPAGAAPGENARGNWWFHGVPTHSFPAGHTAAHDADADPTAGHAATQRRRARRAPLPRRTLTSPRGTAPPPQVDPPASSRASSRARFGAAAARASSRCSTATASASKRARSAA